MELSRVRSEYHAGVVAARLVALITLVPLAAALVLLHGRLFAVSAFLAMFISSCLGFSTYRAAERRAVRRQAGAQVTVAPPTLATRTGFLRQNGECSAPADARREAYSETFRRCRQKALPAAASLTTSFGVMAGLLAAATGRTATAAIVLALAGAGGQAAALVLIHLLGERWAARWERRTGLVLLRDTRQTSRGGAEPLYSEVNGVHA